MATKPSPWQIDAAQVASTYDWLYAGNAAIFPLWNGSGDPEAYENPGGLAGDEVTPSDLYADPSATSWVSPAEGPAINPMNGGTEAAWIYALGGFGAWLETLPETEHTIIFVFRNSTDVNDGKHFFVLGDGDGVFWVASDYEFDGNHLDGVWDDNVVKTEPRTANLDAADGALHVVALRRLAGNYEVWVDGLGVDATEVVNNNFSINPAGSNPGLVPGSSNNAANQAIDAEIHAIYVMDGAASDANLATLDPSTGDPFGPITQAAAAGPTGPVAQVITTGI